MDAKNIAIAFLGEEIFAPLHILEVRLSDPLALEVSRHGSEIRIAYGDKVGFFLGLSLVKQNADKNEFSLQFKRQFAHNGSMFDCSRNAVLNVNQVKEMILVSALMGLNRFMLYTEDTYEVEGEPYFGYFRGRYTKEELKEIADYGEAFGVDVVPCIQTLSHLNQALRWNVYSSIRDTKNTLKLGLEETKGFIERRIKLCKECFHSKYIHIGMDEAFDMGLSQFLSHQAPLDRKEAFLTHLNLVVSLCEKYGLHPLMWEDMFFKLDPKAKPDWYDFEGKLEPDIKQAIPNVDLIYWDYYHDDKAVYDRLIKTSLDTGKNVVFASGLIRWIGFVPNYDCSFKKGSAGLKAARGKLKDVFATTWGDGGAECSAVSLYPMLALHSVYDYEEKPTLGKVSGLLKTITGLTLNQWRALQLPNTLRDELLPFENPSKSFLYQDVLLGLFDTRAKMEFGAKYSEHAKTLKRIGRRSERFGYPFDTAAHLCDVLSMKATIGKRLRAAYKANDKESLMACVKDLKVIQKKIRAFMISYEKQYERENKPFGYEVTDGRLGFLLERIDFAIRKVNRYLNGEISSIPELEQEVLPYSGAPDDEPHCYNDWKEIVSASLV